MSRECRKDAEILAANSKLEDAAGVNAGTQRKLKEALARIQELEDELEQERQARAKVEKQRQQLEGEMDELNERLEEQGGLTSAQQELNKKREAELGKLRRDLEEAHLQAEQATAAGRKKLQEVQAELAEQLDQSQKAKAKCASLLTDAVLNKSAVDPNRQSIALH